MKKYILLTIIFPLIVSSQSFVPNAPELDLKSYILIEPNTNTVIAEFNSSDFIEPASMTKVMTPKVVAEQIKIETSTQQTIASGHAKVQPMCSFWKGHE